MCVCLREWRACEVTFLPIFVFVIYYCFFVRACRSILTPRCKCSLIVNLCALPVGIAAAWWQPLSTLCCLLSRPLRCSLTHTLFFHLLSLHSLTPHCPGACHPVCQHKHGCPAMKKDRENSPAVAAGPRRLSNTLERSEVSRAPSPPDTQCSKKNVKKDIAY